MFAVSWIVFTSSCANATKQKQKEKNSSSLPEMLMVGLQIK
jgi:hypothetical protein